MLLLAIQSPATDEASRRDTDCLAIRDDALAELGVHFQEVLRG